MALEVLGFVVVAALVWIIALLKRLIALGESIEGYLRHAYDEARRAARPLL